MARAWIGIACCALLGLSSVRKGSERRMIGDWEPADAYLVGHHSLWQSAVDRILEELQSSGVALVSPEADSHESAWVRDYGPIAATEAGRVLWLDTEYYSARSIDDALPASLARRLGVPVVRLAMRLEGGGVSSDGLGICVMTETSRNAVPDGRAVLDRLGCRTLVVVAPLPGEPTGHVDLAVQFLSPEIVAVADLRGENIPLHAAARLDSAAAELVAAARSAGRTLRVLRVPVFRDGEGRYYSYVNFVSLPDRLLVPNFASVPRDIQGEAYRILRSGSSKDLVPIPADELARSGGGLHCIVLGLHHGSTNLSPEKEP